MGFSLRNDDWRYTAWVGWNGSSLTPAWGRVNATELYRHTLAEGGPGDQDFDAWENENEAGRPERRELAGRLHAQLRAHFDRFAVPYAPPPAP